MGSCRPISAMDFMSHCTFSASLARVRASGRRICATGSSRMYPWRDGGRVSSCSEQAVPLGRTARLRGMPGAPSSAGGCRKRWRNVSAEEAPERRPQRPRGRTGGSSAPAARAHSRCAGSGCERLRGRAEGTPAGQSGSDLLRAATLAPACLCEAHPRAARHARNATRPAPRGRTAHGCGAAATTRLRLQGAWPEWRRAFAASGAAADGSSSSMADADGSHGGARASGVPAPPGSVRSACSCVRTTARRATAA
jgi:hypothetical protein